ncbi:SmpA/OmlA superfamily protein [Syntrophotalea carbinolica DSM 2380]|uniref:SmpA/OmlA superfamily protein n=1 Tax=Syntrophotalea carbinolica (strain DSM 2380 / NBRC 103641 / GraBd1) TaxID=338963 RepID=Q0C6T1_SYNC1|nr:outer membrane protein assembly factor BamE [Syntrophotalea carbinolica]ABI81856.1 SmpA/OmlA superfamily protein [Syntrophotalea carbinolica DSM 2380]
MKFKFTFIIFVFLVLSGCAPWKSVDKIDLGMTKAQVLQLVGKPESVNGAGNEEYFWYVPANKFWTSYYVRFIDGKVESYGLVDADKE